MTKSKIFLIHILCWVLILGYQNIGSIIEAKDFVGRALGVSISVIRIIEFYICFLWVYPKYLKRGKVLQLILGVIFTLVVFISLRYLIEEVLYLKWFGFHNYSKNTTLGLYILDNIYYGISYIIIPLAVYGVQQNFKTELVNRKLQEEVVKAELSFLKAQINPHFLYNTLNYVYALAIPVSEKLSDAILKLSDLMRYTLNESKDGTIHLDKEVEYLKSYIDLFRMRFEPDFYVNFEIYGLNKKQKIAQLLLVTFVENALKHGVVNESKHPVKIILKVQNNRLSFEVSNKINRTFKDSTSGIGLINVKRRLDLIYPNRHELLISNNGNTYKASLVINL